MAKKTEKQRMYSIVRHLVFQLHEVILDLDSDDYFHVKDPVLREIYFQTADNLNKLMKE